MPVTVITDSAAALPPELAAELAVVVVPMQLEIAGRPVAEADLSLDELVKHLDDGVQTSGPAPGAFVAALDEHAGADGAVIVTVGRRYSSTFQSATSAAALAGTGPVAVVDSVSAAGGEALVVLAAARAARAGAGLAEVEDAARRAVERVRLVAAVEELRHLVRGGRLPASAARFGTHLGVRVLFELRASGPRPLWPTMSTEAAMEQLVERLTRSPRAAGAALHVVALHALRPLEAETLLAMVRKEAEPATAFVGTFGPVMVAHTGPGVVGLAWWWEEPPGG